MFKRTYYVIAALICALYTQNTFAIMKPTVKPTVITFENKTAPVRQILRALNTEYDIESGHRPDLSSKWEELSISQEINFASIVQLVDLIKKQDTTTLEIIIDNDTFKKISLNTQILLLHELKEINLPSSIAMKIMQPCFYCCCHKAEKVFKINSILQEKIDALKKIKKDS